LPDAEGDVGAIVRSDAGRFFVDRATAVDRGFALTPTTARSVARICNELDGLPLALGLAAARVEHMAPREIADGLSRRGRLSGPSSDSAVPQHRSVRASLDWSYGLLTEEASTRRSSSRSMTTPRRFAIVTWRGLLRTLLRPTNCCSSRAGRP
jgi:predicted ATPase